MPKLNVQQNNANVIKALRNALAIGQIKGPIASDGNDNFTSTGSNRNLLDNWYFVGGGSQLGDGVFPINQRGQSTYTGGGTQLDRWHGLAGTDTLVLTANGLQYTSPSSNGIFQYFPVFPTPQTVTFSVKVNGTITSITLAEGTIHAEEVFLGYKLTVDRNDKCVGIFSLNETILLQAAKLEVGTVSTLANDAPPNYWLELQKCKARLRFVPLTRCPIVFAAGNAYLDLNGCEMEGAPIAALYANDGAVVGSSGASSAITSVTFIGIGHNVPLLQFNLASAINDQVGQIYNTVVQLSSEL